MAAKGTSVLLVVLSAVVVLGLAACGTTTPTGLVGNATAGQTLYTSTRSAAQCHPSAAALKPFAGLITNNMGTINPAMSGITLTNQQIADLRAFLATQ
ncbi:MAG TPA: hypothetical protein VMV94_09650 [Phycisphaerae bacterium]|nr:hypothetical protein [Phycisphaerae bacterium]